MPDTTALMSAVILLPRQSLPRPHSISFATSLAPTAGITLSLYTLTDSVTVYSAASSMQLCCTEIIRSTFATSLAPGTGIILTSTLSQTPVTVQLTFCLTTSAGVVLVRTVPQPHRLCRAIGSCIARCTECESLSQIPSGPHSINFPTSFAPCAPSCTLSQTR